MGAQPARQAPASVAVPENLRHLLSSISGRIQADGATGLYGGAVETSLSVSVSFADFDRQAVLAALAKFADDFI